MNFKIFGSLIFIIQVCWCRPPINIPPVNPDDPPVLPAGLTRNVLVIGKNKSYLVLLYLRR